QRLGDARHALEQDVTVGQQPDHQLLHHVLLADDHPLHLRDGLTEELGHSLVGTLPLLCRAAHSVSSYSTSAAQRTHRELDGPAHCLPPEPTGARSSGHCLPRRESGETPNGRHGSAIPPPCQVTATSQEGDLGFTAVTQARAGSGLPRGSVAYVCRSEPVNVVRWRAMSTPQPPPGQPEYVPVHPLLPEDPPKIGDFWLDARLTASESGVVYTGHADSPNGGVPVMLVLLSEGAAGDAAARDRFAGVINQMHIDTVLARGGQGQDFGRLARRYRSEDDDPVAPDGHPVAPWAALAYDGSPAAA